MPRSRTTWPVAAFAAAAALLSACSGTVEGCSDVGWISTVRVVLSGDAAQVGAVVYCPSSCPDGDLLTAGEEGAAPQVVVGVRQEDSTWTVSTLDTETPAEVTLVALGADGERVAEETLATTW
jgi:hypothetical protein